MQLKTLLGAATAITMLSAGTAVAEPSFFISPMGGFAWSDPDDNDTGIAAHLGIGVNLTKTFALELKGFYNELDIDASNLYRQKGASIDAMYKFYRTPSIELYGVAGLGFVRQDVPGVGQSDDDDSVDPSVDIGAGLLVPLNALKTALRADIRYRNDYHGDADTFGRSSFYQIISTAGLLFPYQGETGASAPPPPPPRRVAVAPKPPKRPVKVKDKDSDGDGIVDRSDKCPNTEKGRPVLPNGCSVAKKLVLDGVNFETNSARLTRNARAILDDVAETIIDTPDIDLEVSGHTDSVGNSKYNQRLSEERASSVRRYLIKQGVKSSRLTDEGYGESKPVASNDNSEGRAKNRRVELSPISDEDNAKADTTAVEEEEVAAASVEAQKEVEGLSGAVAETPLTDWVDSKKAASSEATFLAFSGDTLAKQARAELTTIASQLMSGTVIAKLEIEGKATPAQAKAIHRYLVTQGVRSKRLSTAIEGNLVHIDYSL